MKDEEGICHSLEKGRSSSEKDGYVIFILPPSSFILCFHTPTYFA